MSSSLAEAGRKALAAIRRFWLFHPGVLARRLAGPRLPLSPGGRVLVHIGCGELDDRRYINVDCRPGWHINHVATIEECSNLFAPRSVDLIYACHVLEHVSHQKLLPALRGLRQCLKEGGVLRLSVPDFDTIVSLYGIERDINAICSPLMGGQGYPANFHYAVFNEKYLSELLARAGFARVRRWDPELVQDHAFDDWSRRPINQYGKAWPISLNIEAVR